MIYGFAEKVVTPRSKSANAVFNDIAAAHHDNRQEDIAPRPLLEPPAKLDAIYTGKL
jgi:hypothetical protein